MAKTKAPDTDKRTQHQKFMDKARELGTDDAAFEKNLKAIATAPMPDKAAKTPAKKR